MPDISTIILIKMFLTLNNAKTHDTSILTANEIFMLPRIAIYV